MTQIGRRIESFRGLLYDTGRAGPLHDLIAPPYDLIGPAMQHKLYDRSQHNIVRVELAMNPIRVHPIAAHLQRPEVQQAADDERRAELKELFRKSLAGDIAEGGGNSELFDGGVGQLKLLECLLEHIRSQVHGIRWLMSWLTI